MNRSIMTFWNRCILLLACMVSISMIVYTVTAQESITATYDGIYTSVADDVGAAEIVAYDKTSGNLYVVNTVSTTIDMISTESMNLVRQIDVSSYGTPNSVAVNNGLVAVAMASEFVTETGHIAFYDTLGSFLTTAPAGYLPDMVTFSPDGRYVVAANEGEPSDDYTFDPEGSVTIIDLQKGLGNLSTTQVGFTAYNNMTETLLADGARIYQTVTGTTVAKDLEPEYIAFAPDGMTAFVALQENNAIATLDMATKSITAINGLGYKDYSLMENWIDASDKDSVIGNFQSWPVLSAYQPDAIATYEVDGQVYILTANEGDARDYDGYSEEVRAEDLVLDQVFTDTGVFTDVMVFLDTTNLGRLKVTTEFGDTDNDGDFDQIYGYGARSFSIWDTDLNLVYDSGNQFEKNLLALAPEIFNANNTPAKVDNRSDDKGPEPEAVTVGYIDGVPYAFVGLERTGGVMVYNISNPMMPIFSNYLPSNGNFGPEGVLFIPSSDSSNGMPQLAIAHEISNTTTLQNLSLEIIAPTTTPVSGTILQPTPTPSTIVLPEIGDFSGTLTNPDATPVVGATVWLLDADGNPVATALTDAMGGFTFYNVPVSGYTFAVNPNSLADANLITFPSTQVTIFAGNNAPIVVRGIDPTAVSSISSGTDTSTMPFVVIGLMVITLGVTAIRVVRK